MIFQPSDQGEMAQRLKAVIALPEDLTSVLGTQFYNSYNPRYRESDALFRQPLALRSCVCMCVHVRQIIHTHTQKETK